MPLVDDADEDDLLALDPEADRAAVLGALADLRDRLLVSDAGLRLAPLPMRASTDVDAVVDRILMTPR